MRSEAVRTILARSARPAVLALAVTVVLASLAGCWDRRELDEVAHALTVFLDLESDGMLRITVEVLSLLPGGGERGPTAHTVISATGASFQDAVWNLRWQSPAEISLAHVGAIVIGEDLARAGIADILDALDQSYEIRRRVFLAATPGKASDLLGAALTTTRHSEQMLGMLWGVAETGTAGGASTLNEAMRTLASEGKDLMLVRFVLVPAPPVEHVTQHAQSAAMGGGGETGEGGGGETASGARAAAERPPVLSLRGAAVFRGDVLAGFLEEREAGGIQLVLKAGRNRRIRVTTGTPRQGFTLRSSSARPRVTVEQVDDRLFIQLRLHITASLEELEIGPGDMALPADISHLEALAAEHVRAMVLDGLWYCVSQHGADPAGFGRTMSRWRPDLWDGYKTRWPEALKDAKIQAEVSVSIPNTGMLRAKARGPATP